MTAKKNLVLFDQGTENSVLILEDLYNKGKEGSTTFRISSVVSAQCKNSLFERAEELGLPYYYFQSQDDYEEIAEKTQADIFLFYNWENEIVNFKENTNFKKSNVVCIYPGPWQLKGKNFGEFKNVHEYLLANFDFTNSEFTVYFYGANKNDLTNMFSFVKVPINGTKDASSLERKVIKAGITKLSFLLDLVVKGQISLNQKGCINLPEKWVKEFGRVNVK